MSENNPSWLEIHRDENRAFISIRTSNESVVDWGLFTAEAQYVIGSKRYTEDSDNLLNYDLAQDLVAASRVLDCASQVTKTDSIRHAKLYSLNTTAPTTETGKSLPFPEEGQDFSLTLLAAAAYAIHGNFCSATAIINRDPPNSLSLSAVENAIIALCAPNLTGSALEGVYVAMQIERQKAIHADSPFGESSTSKIAKFLEGWEFLLRTGDEASCHSIYELYKDCFSPNWTSIEMALWGTCRLCITHAIKLSVARNLRMSGIPFQPKYIENLTKQGKRIFFPSQLRAFQKGLLQSDNENCLVSLPTSAGKTFLSELLIVSSLISEGASDKGTVLGCYIVPYIALGNQVASVLYKHLSGTGISVHKIFGDYPWPGDELHTSSKAIIVATPERLDSILRNHADLLDKVRCVVCDEAHSLESGVRGVRLEGILTRFRLRQVWHDLQLSLGSLHRKRLRIILVSAVISQSQGIMQWLKSSGNAIELQDSWKPTAKRFAIWTQDGKLTWYIGQEKVGSRGLPSETPLGSVRIPWPEVGIGYAKYPTTARPQLLKAFVNVSYLVDYLRNSFPSQPILCVCATKDSTRTLALEIINRVPALNEYGEQIGKAIQIIEANHPFLRPLAKCLRHGVAFHNASLPFEIRDLIEAGVQNREISVVTSTTTLAEGVDLPFRITVLVDWNFYRDGVMSPMSPALFQNILGRCGRAGVYTEGDTIVFDNPVGDYNVANPYLRAQTQKQIFFGGKTISVSSAIAKSLTESPDIGMKACLESQLLAAIQENTNSENIESAFAANSFAAQVGWQTSQIITETYIEKQLQALTEIFLDEYQGQGPLATKNSPLVLTALGKAVNTTAFSPSSSRRIISWLMSMDNNDASDAEFLARLLRTFGDLPEQPVVKFRTAVLEPNPRKGFRYCIRANNIAQIITDWIENSPAEVIFSNLPTVRNSTRKGPTIDEWLTGIVAPSWDMEFDKFAEFTQSVLRGFLPWLLRACKTLSEHLPDYSGNIEWEMLAKKMEFPRRSAD